MHIRLISFSLIILIIIFGMMELKTNSTPTIPTKKNEIGQNLEYEPRMTLAGAHENLSETPSQNPFFQEFEKLFIKYKNELSKKEGLDQKVSLVQDLIVALQDLRNNSDRLSEPEEIYLDLIEDSLKWIVKYKSIKATDCPSIRSSLINQFDPRSGTLPREPSILKTWEILNLMCQ